MGRYTVFRFDQTITMVLSVVIALEDVLESWKWSDVFDPVAWSRSLIRFVKARWNAWAFLFNGPKIIQAEFEQSNGDPFEILAPDGRYVFVSDLNQINEIDAAPDTVFSLQAAARQMLQPKYSMHGFNWFDTRGIEGTGPLRAIRTLLTNHLPTMLPDIRRMTTERLKFEIAKGQVRDGSCQMQIFPTVVDLVVRTNAFAFFGPELAKDVRFVEAALSYVEDTMFIAEIVRLLPRCLVQIIGPMIGKRVSSQKVVYTRLMEVAEERVRERDFGIQSKLHNDCIQWVMESSPKQKPWTAQRIVFELMAIWFGSVHAMSITATFAIQDLCLHPEYLAPLREELESSDYAAFEATSSGLPLLDSFIRESARLTPVESLGTRREVLKPFSLSDGTKLSIGDWACTPVTALMQSGAYYPQPLEFNGFRFVDPRLFEEMDISMNATFQPSPSKLTDLGNTFHMWGTGHMACPGRFYAAPIMKLLVGQIILNYNIDLVDRNAKRWWTWRSSMLPLKSTLVRLSARAEKLVQN